MIMFLLVYSQRSIATGVLYKTPGRLPANMYLFECQCRCSGVSIVSSVNFEQVNVYRASSN